MSVRDFTADFLPVVLTPTYNNDATLRDILDRVASLGLPMIVVNDGSTDQTARILAEWQASAPGRDTHILAHPHNRGKAAALQTGFDAAARDGYTHVVTIDSDGQHDPEQIPALLAVAQRDPEALVLGIRDIASPDYPAKSRLGRRFSNWMIQMECGQRVQDSQCGLRVYPLSLLTKVHCTASGYGFETEIITQAARTGVPIVEAPVNCRYFTGPERVSHFKPWRDSIQSLALHARLLTSHGAQRTYGRDGSARHHMTQQTGQTTTSTASTHKAAPADPPATIPPRERAFIFGLLALTLLLRIIYVFRLPFSSDEPQHLHVAWGWTQGLMQYRDIFDNHTPLFHLAYAPLVAWLGERPDLLILMRLAMIPLYGVTLWATYRIAKNLFNARLAIWAALLAGLYPSFFRASLEFRTDDAWAMLWLLALARLTTSALRWRQALIFGLLAGAAFSVSMKTSLLLACLAAAALSTIALSALGHVGRPPAPRRAGRFLLAVLLGFLIVPGALIAWFALKGALGPLYYGVIGHNLVPGLGQHHHAWPIKKYFVPPFCIALWYAGYRLFLGHDRADGPAFGRTLIFLFAGFYWIAVRCLWPLVTGQDFLPVWPLNTIFAIALTERLWNALAARHPGRFIPGSRRPFVLANLSQWLILVISLPFIGQGRVQESLRTWQAVLTLTSPEEYVMDLKGDLIFRNRAFYWSLESVTRARIKRNLIANDIDQRLIATRTCVIGPNVQQFPKNNRAFIMSNYLSVGPLLVAGQRLAVDPAEPERPITFDIKIAAPYCMVTGSGTARGLLDGAPDTGGRFLDAGRHEYRPAPGERGPLAVVWSRAIERGYRPINLGKE